MKNKELTATQKGWLALLYLHERYGACEQFGDTVLVTKEWFKEIASVNWQSYHTRSLDELVTAGWLIKDTKFYRLTNAARVRLGESMSYSHQYQWFILEDSRQ